MRRFLQHVLPRGFHKVRYFGLWHPAQRHNATRVRQMLQLQAPKVGSPPEPDLPSSEQPGAEPTQPIEPRICPRCYQGRLVFVRTVSQHTPWHAMAP
jgi:Putative transposase